MARQASAVNYKWESVGDQDALIRKICYLGPYLLEHVESDWVESKRGSVMMMASNIYLWNDKSKLPDLIASLPEVEYEMGKSWSVLEDWYALNVLAEELFMGNADELVSTKERKD